MNRKKLTKLGIVIAIILAIVGLGAVAGAANAQGGHRYTTPKVSIPEIQKKLGCKPGTSEISYDYEHLKNYKSVQCRDKAGVKVYGENYLLSGQQASDIFWYEAAPKFGLVAPYWLARCDGYNAYVWSGASGENWVKRFAKANDCKAIRLDGSIEARKAGLPG